MGTGEESTSAKPTKPASSTQEIQTTLPYPDWSNSVQAYYGPGSTPPPFFAPTVASPTPHPYLWGGQHPLIPPYGTPVPYPALYPSGGVYAHPNMATVPTAAQANMELEGKGTNGKERASAKKNKGTTGSKATEGGKVTSGSGNDGTSQSAESGSDGFSEASDENAHQQEFAGNKKGSFNQMLADASAHNIQASVRGKPAGSMPATNLNIGMDLWSTSPASEAAKMRPNPPGASSGVIPATVPEQWIQDERELKRQKRKQSNRESARRSRLRKQAECEELQTRVENLSKDNHNLREELQRLSEECDKLKSENDSIKEELIRIYGPKAITNIEQSNSAPLIQSNGDEAKS